MASTALLDVPKYKHDLNFAPLVSKLQNMDVEDMWFQQESTIFHAARETFQVIF